MFQLSPATERSAEGPGDAEQGFDLQVGTEVALDAGLGTEIIPTPGRGTSSPHDEAAVSPAG